MYRIQSVSARALAQGQKVVVLDHHISERTRMHEMAAQDHNLTFVFDNEKSGASLAWTYFFPETPLPKLIAHVEDIDLWHNAYGEKTEHVASYLSLLRNDPEAVRALFVKDINTLYAAGEILTKNMHLEVQRLLEIPPLMLTVGPHTVPAFNIGNYQSQCGNALATTHNSVVVLYTIRGDVVRLSIRSNDAHEPSAQTIAEAFGGGGHRNASGATVPTQDFIKNLTF